MSPHAWLGDPVDVRGLFGPERTALLELLGGLDTGRWQAPALPGWNVRDVASHLLGDDYSRLSWAEGHDTAEAPRPGEAFEAFVHRTNREWVQASRRLSPLLLMETLELTGRRVARMWAHSDLHAASRSVSWAGADPAPLWLDCARDLTEYWTHRQQIRAAIGLPAAGTPSGPPVPPAAQVELDAATAWRLCVRAIGPEAARSRARLRGDRRLGEAVCRMVSIIR